MNKFNQEITMIAAVSEDNGLGLDNKTHPQFFQISYLLLKIHIKNHVSHLDLTQYQK